MDGTLETSVLKRTRYFDGTTELSSDLIVQNFMVTDEVSAFGISIFSNIQMFMVPSIALQNYLYVADTGVYDYGGHDDPTTEATLIVPLPLEIGKGWERGRASSFEAVAEEDVVVPAGNYKAMKVFLDEDGLGEAAYYEWYAQDVGMIKSAMTFSYAPMVIDIDGRAIPSTMEVEGSYIEELVRKNF